MTKVTRMRRDILNIHIKHRQTTGLAVTHESAAVVFEFFYHFFAPFFFVFVINMRELMVERKNIAAKSIAEFSTQSQPT